MMLLLPAAGLQMAAPLRKVRVLPVNGLSGTNTWFCSFVASLQETST